MRNHKQVTISDIAKTLGIAPSTVSRALNDHPSISDKTKQQVLTLAKQYDYQPNRLALSLLHHKTGIIGIIVPEITGYFFATIISGVQDMVNSAGYKLLIYQSNESFNEETRILREMVSMRVDGILLSPSIETHTYEHLYNLKKRDIPLVIFDRDITSLDVDKVLVDSFEGAYQAVLHLIQSGCRSIGLIAGPKDFPTFQQRIDGYLQAHRDQNLPIQSKNIVFSKGFSSMDGELSTLELLQNNGEIDAIFAVNDAIAIAALYTVRQKGFKIPDNISVIGFDDEPYTQYFNPPITTVWQPAYELGMLSAKILLDRFSSKIDSQKYRCEILSPELVIRESSKLPKILSDEIAI